MSKVYTGLGRAFQEITSLPMDLEALTDIEQRIKLQPHFLGEPLVVVGETADFPEAVDPHHRVMAALDALGRSVAIVLAVGAADVTLATPAMQLASHLSDMANTDLGKKTAVFIRRPSNESLMRLWEEMDVEMDAENIELSSLLAAAYERDAEDYRDTLNRQQRVIIAAEGFTQRLVQVIQWMKASGMNIKGLRYRRYLVGGQEVYFAEQVVPSQDPAVDAPRQEYLPQEIIEPWRAKGRLYYLDRLSPSLSATLDALLLATRDHTFTLNWSHPSYFWIRGSRRNFRVRTYHRDRIDLGFYNAAPAAAAAFLAPYRLEGAEILSVGGYADSPFIALTTETRLDEQWFAMLADWLSGSPPGRSLEPGSGGARPLPAPASAPASGSGAGAGSRPGHDWGRQNPDEHGERS
ncbi:MAG: hypothetical protein FWG74_02995 [Planctomycetes bacterium]|nr:hypothetical protein [Planctomycetota bacterium]